MKLLYMFLFGCVISLCYTSPIQKVENHELIDKITRNAAKSIGKQSSVSNPVAQAVDAGNDDDDEEDDDIVDFLVDDDDDDDDDEDSVPAASGNTGVGTNTRDEEDEEDDDDDSDYLERIFDDILEDDDDDDDDEDVSPSLGATQQQVQAGAAQSSALVTESVATDSFVSPLVADSEAPAGAGLNIDYPNEADQTVFYEEENGGIDTKVDVLSINNKPQGKPISNDAQKVSQTQALSQATNDVSNDDDDDEDEVEEIAGSLGVYDDDDDDDDEDSDDDDDDLIGEDTIEAKHSRSFENSNLAVGDMQHRYNRFVDVIFERINKILKESYDPVRVRLFRSKGRKAYARKGKNLTGFQKKQNDENKKQIKSFIKQNSTLKEPVEENVSMHPSEILTSLQLNNTMNLKFKKPIEKNSVRKISKHSDENKSKRISDSKMQKPRGTLYGLASLQRLGNVKVTPEENTSNIKSKFTLGPLTLKVEKSVKRGSVKTLKSATARTNEMLGRINLRIVGGAATLVSIKVQQPKQVQVESSGNHDKTREFVWKRTPHLAHLVSEKIRAAAETLLLSTNVHNKELKF